MITLDFNKQAIDIKGNPLTARDKETNEVPVIISEQLGQTLAYSIEKDNGKIVKYWTWATCLGRGEVLTLDKVDLNTLKQFVEAADIYIWIKAQILEIIETAKEQ
jgi:hypothetical protein